MELAPGTTLHGFTVLENDELAEIDGRAITGVHASGARLLCLPNDDNNKAFAIGFRTPPQDDTGVFHILEHSVLCGSRRFPVKEPFVDLLKTSMQTFLNAMTFADKTLYPVASTNEQDLFNLMDVYLDAVFHPNIYEKEAIFQQEGWHYELRALPGAGGAPADLPADRTELVHNGVVFNEMKGALSDASSVLYDELQKALLPGTCYAFESGGTPEAIPTLTYEGFIEEHRRHYRTDNSYIVLYGNLDLDRALAFIDERYLAPVAAEQAHEDERRAAEGLPPLRPRQVSAADGPAGGVALVLPPLQDRCGGSPDPVTVPLPAGTPLPEGRPHAVEPAQVIRKTMDTAPENACAACGYVIGTSADRTRAVAVDILVDALFGSNEAPCKRALLDARIAHDVNAFVSDALLQPFAVVQLQVPAEGAAEGLAHAVADAVRGALEGGIDRDLLEAALSHAEFEMREHDMGLADGVAYAMIALSSWLYDDGAATDYLRYEDAFAVLRRELENGYFDRLAAEVFCENPHVACVEVVPGPDAAADEQADRLRRLNEGLSAGERAAIVEGEALLRDLQQAPDSPEAVATLPRLGVADIGGAPDEPRYDLDWRTPVTCLRHSVPTRGIAYAYRYFDADRLAFDDLPYLSVLSLVLGKLGTAHHTAAELDTLTQGKLGNLSFFTEVYTHRADASVVMPKFVVGASALSANSSWLADLPREVMTETDFSDAGKILDILRQRKVAAEQHFVNAGHSCAAARAKSYYAPSGVVGEQLGNVGFYRFLCDLIDNYDDRAADLAARLADVAQRLFHDDTCTMSFAGSDEDYDRFWMAKPGTGADGDAGRLLQVPQPKVAREAFAVPTDVCYAALGWDRRLLGEPYAGSWAVAARALSYDYLWNEVRVKGGAYGVGFQALRSGNLHFYSYRDPHLGQTLRKFSEAVDWLASFEPSAEAMEGFVVATAAKMDTPLKPRAIMRRQAGEFFRMQRPDERLKTRDEVIGTGSREVRALAPVLRRAVAEQARCAFGNRAILQAAAEDFEVITLFGDE